MTTHLFLHTEAPTRAVLARRRPGRMVLATDEPLRTTLASHAAASVADLDEARLLERIVRLIEESG